MSQPFVVQIDNRPGELAHVARALAVRGINIRHIAGNSAGKQMCLIVTTDDDKATRDVLHSMGFPFVEGDALHVEVEDAPGALADFSEKLAAAGVNITGVVISGHHAGMCEIAVTVDNEEKTRDILGLPKIGAVPVPH